MTAVELREYLAAMRESGARSVKIAIDSGQIEATFAAEVAAEVPPDPPSTGGQGDADLDDDVPWNARDPIAEANLKAPAEERKSLDAAG